MVAKRFQGGVKIERLSFTGDGSGYDLMNRVKDLSYPNGIIVHNQYSFSGNLENVTMDYPEKGSFNHSVERYEYDGASASVPAIGNMTRKGSSDAPRITNGSIRKLGSCYSPTGADCAIRP